jgi:thymidylate kinase
MSTAAARKATRAPRARARRATCAENRHWVGEHYDQLLARYPEQWIAVQNTRVIASDPSVDALLERVPESLEICIELMIKDSEEPYDEVILIPGPGSTRALGTRTRMEFRRLSPEENEKAARELRAFEEDSDWIEEHYQELLAQYPEQWVAVQNKRVIASDPDLSALRARVPHPGNTNVEFITKEEVDFLL